MYQKFEQLVKARGISTYRVAKRRQCGCGKQGQDVTGKEERMRQGFVKVAAVTPKIRVADTGYNAKVICQSVKEAAEAGAKVIVLPELCITGYTCGDLFLQEKLLREAKEELLHIAAFTMDVDAIVFVGLPLAYKGKLYNLSLIHI